MAEEKIVAAFDAALRRDGIDDRVDVAGEFSPRGASGGMFAGGLVGDSVGGLAGSTGSSIGTVGGAFAGRDAAARARGMPTYVLVGVSSTAVYGYAGRRSGRLGELVFRVDRAGLHAQVHQRVNVRVLVLSSPDGSVLELEGNRLPLTHSRDVVDALTGTS